VELRFANEAPRVLASPNTLGSYVFEVAAPRGTGCESRPYVVTVTDTAGQSLSKYGTVCPFAFSNSGAFSDYGDRTITFRDVGQGGAHTEFRRWNPAEHYLDEFTTNNVGSSSWTVRAKQGDELVLSTRSFDGGRTLFIEADGRVLDTVSVPGLGAGELRITCCTARVADTEFVPLRRIAVDWYAEWPVRTYEFRSQAEWATLFAGVRSVGNPQPPLPPVDFSRDAVLGVSLGWASSPCSTVGIRAITRSGNDYTVRYAENVTPSTAQCAGAVVPSTAFVQVPQPVGRVTFVRLDP
jgi:hypothetical protein